MKINEVTRNQELTELCIHVRDLVSTGEYEKCSDIICKAMGTYPNAPQPHNLLGVVMEMTGDHISAMKHFRAAWALDPTYYPSCQNLNNYGTFYCSGPVAYDECDCHPLKADSWKIEDRSSFCHHGRRK